MNSHFLNRVHSQAEKQHKRKIDYRPKIKQIFLNKKEIFIWKHFLIFNEVIY